MAFAHDGWALLGSIFQKGEVMKYTNISATILITLSLGVCACHHQEPAEGPMENAGEETDEAAAEAKEKAKDAADDVEDAADDAADDVEDAADDAAD